MRDDRSVAGKRPRAEEVSHKDDASFGLGFEESKAVEREEQPAPEPKPEPKQKREPAPEPRKEPVPEPGPPAGVLGGEVDA